VFPGRVDTPLIESIRVPAVSAKIPPEAVASAIVRALRTRQPEVILPFQARLLYWVNALSPSLGDWFVRILHLEGWEVSGSEPGSLAPAP
jgi:short-subunit dehydrogenase